MAKRKRPPGRAYARLTRHERNEIGRLLDRGKGCREIARSLGRAPSTVANEVAAHRYVTAPRALRGERAPADAELASACPRLGSWPRCCNGCPRRRGYGCSRRPQVFYDARMAQREADAVLSDSRRGLDRTEAEASRALALIRDGLARGLSPEQIAGANPGAAPSASTIYRWVDAGYAGMTALDLRRKVGYKKRRGEGAERSTSHSARRSHASFLSLGEACAGAWEMDSVLGARGDSARALTLLHRPTRFQLALPLADGTCAGVLAALRDLSAPLGGPAGARRVFGLVLTDNGPEFSDEGAIASLLGERPGETRLFYCDPRRADQKGACERNHVELRKLLPKGASMEGLTAGDLAEAMSMLNSEPRPALGGALPIRLFRAALGEDAEAVCIQ